MVWGHSSAAAYHSQCKERSVINKSEKRKTVLKTKRSKSPSPGKKQEHLFHEIERDRDGGEICDRCCQLMFCDSIYFEVSLREHFSFVLILNEAS